MTLYKNKYRIESTRLPHHNYAANGWYFVTICTKDKLWFFGDIVSGNIQFSAIGEIATKFWSDIPNHFQDVYLDAYIIMPNHVHGIIVIERSHNEESHEQTHGDQGETRHGTSLQGNKGFFIQPLQFGLQLLGITPADGLNSHRWFPNSRDH